MAALLFLVLPYLYFWRSALPLGGERRFWAADFTSYYFPNALAILGQLKQGSFPLWDPSNFNGMPLALKAESAFFYPPNLLLFSLATLGDFSGEQLYNVLLISELFHLSLAGFFMYLLLRDLKLPSFSSFFGGVVFAFNGFFTVFLNNLVHVNSACWLPLLFLFSRRAFKLKSWRCSAAAALVLGLSILAGHPQISLLYSGLMIFFLFLFYIFQPPRQLPRRLATGLVILLLGVGTAGVALLPGYQLAKLSNRASLSYDQAALSEAVAPKNLLDFFVPFFFSGDLTEGGTNFLKGNEKVRCYLGILPLLLAVFGALFAERKRQRLTVFFSVSGLVFLGLSLGGHFFLYPLTYLSVPGMSLFRHLKKLLYLVAFCIAALSAFGLERFLGKFDLRGERGVRRFWYVALSLVPLLVFFSLQLYLNLFHQVGGRASYIIASNMLNTFNLFLLIYVVSLAIFYFRIFRYRDRSQSLLRGLIIGVLVTDLFSFGLRLHNNNREARPWELHAANQVTEYLENDPGLFRVYFRGRDRFSNLPQYFGPGALGFHAPFGYQATVLQGVNALKKTSDFEDFESSLYDFLNVKYFVSYEDLSAPSLVPVFQVEITEENRANYFYYADDARGWRNAKVGAALTVFENRDAYPRFFLSEERFSEGEFPSIYQGGDVRLIAYEPANIELEIFSPQELYLISSEVWYPGWRVWVNGGARKLEEGTFRFLRLSPGQQTVKFSFFPRILVYGGITTALSLVLGGYLVLKKGN